MGPVKLRGTTTRDADGKEWRSLTVFIPPVDPGALTRPVTIDMASILLFRTNFFGDGAEVLMYVPRPQDEAYTLKLWSRVEDAVLPAKDGFPKATVLAEG